MDRDQQIASHVKCILNLMGEDPDRNGLYETPIRVARSFQHLYSGYGKDPKDVIKTFDGEAYDQMVILRDIEIYSMCEHHMLPFFGKALVAYIPCEKVIGISKLARLLEIYCRRLQIQERIGEQVTSALMDYLDPKGAACIIKAQHLCMMARGIEKQNSVMITSSIKGQFLKDERARMEVMAFTQGD